jgi:hypothetical protein
MKAALLAAVVPAPNAAKRRPASNFVKSGLASSSHPMMRPRGAGWGFTGKRAGGHKLSNAHDYRTKAAEFARLASKATSLKDKREFRQRAQAFRSLVENEEWVEVGLGTT